MTQLHRWYESEYRLGFAEPGDPPCRGCGVRAVMGSQVITMRYRVPDDEVEKYRKRMPLAFEKSEKPELFGPVEELWHTGCAERVGYRELWLKVGPGGGRKVREDTLRLFRGDRAGR